MAGGIVGDPRPDGGDHGSVALHPTYRHIVSQPCLAHRSHFGDQLPRRRSGQANVSRGETFYRVSKHHREVDRSLVGRIPLSRCRTIVTPGEASTTVIVSPRYRPPCRRASRRPPPPSRPGPGWSRSPAPCRPSGTARCPRSRTGPRRARQAQHVRPQRIVGHHDVRHLDPRLVTAFSASVVIMLLRATAGGRRRSRRSR